MSANDSILVVVGGSSGIGAACVALGVRDYATVMVLDVAPPRPDGDPDRVRFIETDATDEDSVTSAFSEIRPSLDPTSAVITMVGGATPKPFLEHTLADWHHEIEFNLTSAFLVARESIRAFAGGGGSLVLTSSGFGTRPGPGRVGYAAAKAGVTGLARSLASEFGPAGLRVNAVSPGPTRTDRFDRLLSEDEKEDVRNQSVLRRISDPDDVAAAALFLASPRSRQITGQVLHVDGGTYFSP